MNIYPSSRVLPYVYKLTHKETGQFYFGYRKANKVPSTEDLGKYYFTSSKRIHNIGFENFDFEVVAEFFDYHDALEFEDYLIRESWSDPLKLNRCAGGSKFHCDGHSEETLVKMSNHMKGKPAWNKGLHHTPEQRQKLSLAWKTRPPITDETRAKIGEASRNSTAETRAKISNALKGKPRPVEVIEKIKSGKVGCKGRVWTPESIAKREATRAANRLKHKPQPSSD